MPEINPTLTEITINTTGLLIEKDKVLKLDKKLDPTISSLKMTL